MAEASPLGTIYHIREVKKRTKKSSRLEVNNGKEGEARMQWQIVAALVVAIPIILLPVVFVWYLNMGSIVAAFQRARARRAGPEKLTVTADIKAK